MSNIIYGDQNFFLPSHLNFGKYVLDNILKYSDKTALIDAASGNKITFNEIAKQIVSTATTLTELGVKQEDVVAICSENRMEYFIAVLAIFCSGGVVACINNGYSEDEILHALNISKPKFMFLSSTSHKIYYGLLKPLKMIEKFIILGEEREDYKIINFKSISQRNIDVDKYQHGHSNGGTALILYSSGTTGLAKGAKITHCNLITSLQQPLSSTKKYLTLSVAPWSSTMGFILSLKEIYIGRTMVFLPRFNEKQYIEAIQTYKIGMLTVAPPIIVILCKSSIAGDFDLTSLEAVYSGGAPLNPVVIEELKRRYPNIKYVLQGYGMTETTGALTNELETARKEGSVGKIVPGNIIKVVDVETRKTLGPGKPGEVCVKGPVLFDGYIGKEYKDDIDNDGFYKTGDIAYYDEEGFFYIVDRIKDLIKYKAWQVPPSDLEGLLLKHPAVKDVGIVGKPDILAGELPTAFIVKQPDANVTEKEIMDYVQSKVSPWKRLRGGVIFVKEIPKTGSGKIIRRNLREMLPKLPASKL